MSAFSFNQEKEFIDAFVNGVYSGRFESEREMEHRLYPICEFQKLGCNKTPIGWVTVSTAADDFIFMRINSNRQEFVRITYKQSTGLFDADGEPIYYGKKYVNEERKIVLIKRDLSRRPNAVFIDNPVFGKSLDKHNSKNYRRLKDEGEV